MMRKSVQVQLFDKDGVFVAEDSFEFESRFNKPRKTFMPDAVRHFRQMQETGQTVNLTAIADRLRDEPGSYILLSDRYGYPVLIPPEPES